MLPQYSGGLESEFSFSLVSCQSLPNLTCPFASYTAGHSVPPCDFRLRPSHLTPLLSIIIAIQVDFPVDNLGPATDGFACNYPVKKAWAAEASWSYFTSMVLSPAMLLTDNIVCNTMENLLFAYILRTMISRNAIY